MSELTREYFDGEMNKVYNKFDIIKDHIAEINNKNNLQDYKIQDNERDINNIGLKLEKAIHNFSNVIEKIDNKKANKITLYAFSTFLGLLITMITIIKIFIK